MQHYTYLEWLNTRLKKLKLSLEELKSDLVHLGPRYKNPGLQFQDVERHLEYAKPWLDDFMLNFRGLEPHVRILRLLSQKLLVLGLIVLFIVSWWTFLRRDGVSIRLQPDNSVFNATLGVCLRTTTLSWEVSADIQE